MIFPLKICYSLNMYLLTRSRCRALSDLCNNAALVFLGSIVIPLFINGFDISKLPVILFGLVLTISTAWLSLEFAEKGKL